MESSYKESTVRFHINIDIYEDGDTTLFVEKPGFSSYISQIPLSDFGVKTQEYIREKVMESLEEQE